MSDAERVSEEKVKRGGKPFAQRLRAVRMHLGLSMLDVSRETGLSYTAVRNADIGRDVTITTALRIAAFFGRSVEELWGETTDIPKEG